MTNVSSIFTSRFLLRLTRCCFIVSSPCFRAPLNGKWIAMITYLARNYTAPDIFNSFVSLCFSIGVVKKLQRASPICSLQHVSKLAWVTLSHHQYHLKAGPCRDRHTFLSIAFLFICKYVLSVLTPITSYVFLNYEVVGLPFELLQKYFTPVHPTLSDELTNQKYYEALQTAVDWFFGSWVLHDYCETIDSTMPVLCWDHVQLFFLI